MFHLLTSETIPLTRGIVSEFRELEGSPTERDLSLTRLGYLRNRADLDLLVPFNWAKAVLDGKEYRVNGQHSSAMLSALNGSFPEGLTVHLDTYRVDAKDDLAELFYQFDPRKSARTSADIAGAYQGVQDDLVEANKKYAKLATEGIAWYNRYISVDGDHYKGDDRYMLFKRSEYHDFIRWLSSLLDVKTPELTKAPIVAAMYITYEKNEVAAMEFWSNVARGGGVSEGEAAPAAVLDVWLAKMHATPRHERRDIKPFHFYQGCIFCWNAYREDKALTRVNIDTRKGFFRPHE